MRRDIYLFSNGRLMRKDNTLYIVSEDGIKRAVPVEQVENVHLFGQIDLNSALFNFSGQKEVMLHFYNYYGFYTGSFYPREHSVSGIVTVKQSDHYLRKEKRLFLAKCFVQSASFHMLRTCRKRGIHGYESVQIITELSKNIRDAKDVQQTMGIEGMIRQHYYRALNELIPEEFTFAERTKRPPRDPFNALISFGNTMMYTSVLSEIYKTQLNPTISYLHEPSQKRFSLCLDLAEIFKPLLVDPLLITLVNKKKITSKHFENHDGMVYLNEMGRKIVIAAFDERLQQTIRHRKLKRNVSYWYLIRLECYKLIKHVIGDTPYIPLKAWW
ncbi:type I-B CRISPR-associated endonuclease Cas1b [Oikeobacillus pervagus]|nr:type I-B CRISPR-associated endonuclease Cas1b [Oikeobacillus pervagus]